MPSLHVSVGVVQRRSAGSWMLGMKYLYGRVKFDSWEILLPIYVASITHLPVVPWRRLQLQPRRAEP
ncbi:MAG: hypothetical protein IJ066_06745 [Bacteroidaceae bacterium]|nr:hypothetical protein [Bacteroidaceae bacterium]